MTPKSLNKLVARSWLDWFNLSQLLGVFEGGVNISCLSAKIDEG
jgi:hypothetical protein